MSDHLPNISNLTYLDRALIAHDYLNPGFGATALAVSAIEADRRDAEMMQRFEELKASDKLNDPRDSRNMSIADRIRSRIRAAHYFEGDELRTDALY